MPGGAELSEKLPEEIFQLVESFRKFVREQRAYRDEKFDVESILEVGRDTEEFTLAFQRVAADSDRNAKLIQQIKDDTTTLLRHSELAYSLLRSHFANNPSFQQQQQQQNQQQQQQNITLGGQLTNGTQNRNLNFGSSGGGNPLDQTNQLNSSSKLGGNPLDSSNQQQTSSVINQHATILHQQQPFYLSGNSPYGSNHHHNQFANTSTSQYFAELADQFEARMKAFGEQIKELKMSLDSIMKTYDVNELYKWLKKQHETLGEIAAKVYMIHERIMEKSELEKLNCITSNLNKTTT